MALLYPISGGRESQQFGPVPVGVAGRQFQLAMYGNHDRAAWGPHQNLPYVRYFHGGLDIAVATGTPILASESGTVLQAGWRNDGSGNVVRVQIKSGIWYEHAHCSQVLVSVGQRVARGQLIARVGATGNVTGPHSHMNLIFVEGRHVHYNPKHFLPGGKWQNDARIRADVSWARVNGDGINIRTHANLLAGSRYARGVSGRIRRYSDNADLGATGSLVAFGGFVEGVRHGIAPHPTTWARLWYGNAYRLVARPLITYAAAAPVHPVQRIEVGAGVNIRRGAGTNFAVHRKTTAVGRYNSPHPYEVIGQSVTQSGITSNRWRTIDQAGTTCYVWAPLARRV